MTINKSSAFIRIILAAGALAVSLLASPVGAASPREMPDDNINLNFLEWLAKGEKIPLDSTIVSDPALDETVLVGGDTVSIILPQKNYGRYDRGLFNYLFIPKGQWSIGLMASYGEFSTDNFQILSVLSNLDLKVKAYSLQPSFSYFSPTTRVSASRSTTRECTATWGRCRSIWTTTSASRSATSATTPKAIHRP